MAQIPVPVRGTVISSSWGAAVAGALNNVEVVAGNSVITTAANGSFTIAAGGTWPAVPVVVLTDGSAWAGSPLAHIFSMYSISTNGNFAAFACTNAGVPIASGAVRVLWVMVGPRR